MLRLGRHRPRGAVLAMFGVQLYYYIFVYGRIPGYKNNRRSAVLDAEPPVSVVVPLFSEDYSFVEGVCR